MGVIAFNVTGVAITEDTGNTRNNFKGQDDSDFDYFDPDEDDIIVDADRGDYNHNGRNAVQRVVFEIDDSVEPGKYRGKVYNRDGGIISNIVKEINVAAVAFDDNNENDSSSNYIIDDFGDKKTGTCIMCIMIAMDDLYFLQTVMI